MPIPEYAFNINYDVTINSLTLNHNHRLRVALADGEPDPSVGTDLADINLRTRGSGGSTGSTPADAGLGEYLQAMCSQFATDMVINAAALTYYPYGIGASGIYVGAADLTDSVAYPQLVGDALSGSAIVAQGAIYTMYNSLGSTTKLALMETRSASNQYDGLADLDTDETEYVTYIIGSTSIVGGVNESYPIAFKVLSTSQNETLVYKRFPKK